MMQHKNNSSALNLWLALPLLLVATSCNTPSIPLPEPVLKLELADPAPLKLSPVSFIVITDTNQQAVFQNLKDTKRDPVLIGLTPDQYQALAYNQKLQENYIGQQGYLIKSYKNFYEGSH